LRLFLLRLLEADTAGAGIVGTLRQLLLLLALLEADTAGAGIVGTLGQLLRRVRFELRRVGDRRRASRMCRQRQSNETGRSKERVADEHFHDWTSGVGGDDCSLQQANREWAGVCLAPSRQ